MIVVRIAACAALVAALIAPAHASAQAYIGNAIGGVIADGEARVRANCEAGVPPLPFQVAELDKRVTLLMDNYMRAAPAGDHKGVSKVFLRTSTTRWKGPDGAVGDWRKVSDPFLRGVAAENIKAERKAFVVANDARGARGVWVITVADPAAPGGERQMEYAIDFVWDVAWGRTYVQHMTLNPVPGTAKPPVAYCKLDPADYY